MEAKGAEREISPTQSDKRDSKETQPVAGSPVPAPILAAKPASRTSIPEARTVGGSPFPKWAQLQLRTL
eukprot:1159109-Pelagomonas_calceolata.AAC.4